MTKIINPKRSGPKYYGSNSGMYSGHPESTLGPPSGPPKKVQAGSPKTSSDCALYRARSWPDPVHYGKKRFKNRQNFDSYCKKVNPNLGHLEQSTVDFYLEIMFDMLFFIV